MDLRDYLRASKRALLFTGAGISTGSGIPDFRGPQGVWTRRQPVYYHDFMTSEAARIEHWDYKLEAWESFKNARPNAVHRAIVQLEEAGKLQVVVTQNIVRAAAFLLFTLAGVSGMFFLLGADFVGATQLLVYVGGTLVLVVFGVMLTAQGPFINMRAGAGEWAVATVVGTVFFGMLAFSLYFGVPATKPASAEEQQPRSLAVGPIFWKTLVATTACSRGMDSSRRAWPSTSSLAPSEYMSAVSKKLTPASHARRKNGRLASSSSTHGRHAGLP